MKNSICILMSTYNGERFLKEQIESILNQEDVSINLIIRDDGSTDQTKKILKDYSLKYDNIIFLDERNIGCKQSFYNVAKFGFEKFQNCDFFAFADQDDYWKPQKLINGIKSLRKCKDSNIPLLYFTPPTIVDCELNEIDRKWRTDNLLTFEEACLIQPCAGCSMVFNRKALELYLRGNIEDMNLHDSWIYISVLACGGKVIEDPESYLLYRQHGNNVVGGNQSKFHTWKRRYKNFSSKQLGRSTRVRNVLKTYGDIMPEANIKSATLIANYRKNFKTKLALLFSKKFRTRRMTANRLFYIAVLLNRF